MEEQEAILARYTDLLNQPDQITILYPVVGGGEVIGQEVSSDNRLLYVIKKEDQLFVEYAQDVNIIQVVHPGSTTTTTVTFNR